MIETIKQNPIPAALAGLSLFWLYRNRSGGQRSYGTGYSSGPYRTPGPYQATRTSQAYPIRTGYASQEERDAMIADAGRTRTGTGSGPRHDSDAEGGVVGSAGRMASSAGQMASGAASSASELAGDVASSAGHLASSAGETAMDAGSGLLDLIQRNPVPAALVGIGLGWLYMNRSSSGPDYRAHSGTHYRYGPAAAGQAYGSGRQGTSGAGDGSMIGRAADQVGELAGSAQERVGDLAGSVQEQVGDVADAVMYRTQRAPGQLQRMIEENPLVTAAVAASLGAAVGLWLPTTQTENQLMGTASDRAMGKVQQVASETIEKVEEVAQEVGSTAREEARSKGLTV